MTLNDDPEPYRALLAAVIKQAWDDYWRDLGDDSNTDAADYSAKKWFFSDSHRVYGFLWVCDCLDLDPKAFRRHLDPARRA